MEETENTVEQNLIGSISSDPSILARWAAKQKLCFFSSYMQPDMQMQPFHEVYYEVLDRFAKRIIKKLIITMPPQHGKSEGSSRKLPSYMLGLNPDLKIAIGSYSTSFARDFNADIQRIIDTPKYKAIFPQTYLNRSNVVTLSNAYKRNSEVIEMVGKKGYLRTVGRGGPLTGKAIDVAIMDDVYKDYEEGNSPKVRKKAWKWYTTVVRTRLPNNGQELIVFTRWHKDDLIGLISQKEQVIEVTKWSDLDNIPDGAWVKINFEAIKTGYPTELDPRERGESLWEDRHSTSKLNAARKLDPVQFGCLYQGNPQSEEGYLYRPFKTYTNPEGYGRFAGHYNYTDVADEGSDYLCSINYDRYETNERFYNYKTKQFDPLVYFLVTDITYTDKDVDSTSESVPQMLTRGHIQKAYIESNNGGSGFAKQVAKKVATRIYAFYQKSNKQGRIIYSAGLVDTLVIMPHDWESRWPIFAEHVKTFLRDFDSNDYDDAPDALTGIIDKELLDRAFARGVTYNN